MHYIPRVFRFEKVEIDIYKHFQSRINIRNQNTKTRLHVLANPSWKHLRVELNPFKPILMRFDGLKKKINN